MKSEKKLKIIKYGIDENGKPGMESRLF